MDNGSGQTEPRDWEQEFGASVAIFSALANPLRLAIAHHLVRSRSPRIICASFERRMLLKGSSTAEPLSTNC